MSDTVISVENLSKSYILKHQSAEKYTTFRDAVANTAKSLFKQGTKQHSREEFWALNDVSFDIKQGERVGIIGRNGAGKSTLLKVLSRIVSPTKGRITIDGRVASLLEVGTGFHPELSGRENIFLNGSILGMTKAEIQSKFDEIVDFAEVEKFLDTPVKRYSSGMYVRLAFAVAAHLEPEILIVDEVLAVGDAAFQKKCLGKMKDVSGEGRTVLFVSHNMGQIRSLCSRGIILNSGKVEFNGGIEDGLRFYHNMQNKVDTIYKATDTNKDIYITEAYLNNSADDSANTFTHDEPVSMVIKFHGNIFLQDLLLSLAVFDKHERKVFSTEALISDYLSVNKQTGEATIKIQPNLLTPGDYKVNAAIHIPNLQLFDAVESISAFTIVDNGSEFARYLGVDIGCVFAKCDWNIK